MNREG
jgi:hypothetical protein